MCLKPLRNIAAFIGIATSPLLCYAIDSTNVSIFTSTPIHQKATVNRVDSSCYFDYTREVLIQAQDGVGAADEDWTGRCASGYVAMELYTFLKVREKHCAWPGSGCGYNVLRAISTMRGILCCPISYTWGT